jgi:hypothetical protein
VNVRGADAGTGHAAAMALLERALGADLTHHLGYEKDDLSTLIEPGADINPGRDQVWYPATLYGEITLEECGPIVDGLR